jgi:hypothetical protein
LASRLPGPYLCAEGHHPEWKTFFDDLLAGKISNVWTRQDWTKVPEILTRWPLSERIGYRLAKTRYRLLEKGTSRYVIKEIRANLLLDWLDRNIDAQIVYLTRHPCAVIGSRMRLVAIEQGWTAEMGEILGQPALMADFLETCRRTIRGAATLLQRQAVLWCVENLVPLSQAGSKDWILCSYEEFRSDKDGAFDRLIGTLGLEKTATTERAKELFVSTPSPGSNGPSPWHAPLTEAQGEEVLRICAEFGLALYGRQAMPLHAVGDAVASARFAKSNNFVI